MITGGENTPEQGKRVVRYTPQGTATLLPSLQEARWGHGCGYYYDQNNVLVSLKSFMNLIIPWYAQTYLVTGGYYNDAYGSTDFAGPRGSTEILSQDSSQWTLTGELPYPTKYLSGTTLDNRLIMAGKIIKCHWNW